MAPKELAQRGFEMIQEAVESVVKAQPGLKCSEIGNLLGLQNSKRGGQHGYVVWTALGYLIQSGKVRYDEAEKTYFAR